MRSYKSIVSTLLFALILTVASEQSNAASNIVEDGKPNAEIVVAEVSPRMTSLAALELQYYLKKISGAKVPIVFENSGNDNIKIYVGKSKYTDEMGIDDKGLDYGAYRIVSGPKYLVLLGYDYDSRPSTTKVEWDKETEEFINVDSFEIHEKSGSKRLNRHQREQWWGRKPQRFNKFMAERYGKENYKVWNPKDIKEYGSYLDMEKTGYHTGFFMADEGGSLNAVYSFLRGLGVRWYMPAEIGEVIPELKTITLPEVDKTDKPDSAVRHWTLPNYAMLPFQEIMWIKRLGMNRAPFKNIGSNFAHGLVAVHKSKDMQEKHPEYYALGRNGKRVTDYRGYGHVCFSNEEFYKTTLKYARFMFDVNDAPQVSLWPCDGFTHCQCEDCKKLSASNLVWGFVDRVARELYKTHPDRIISCGAYTPYVNPPSNVEKFTPNVAVLILKSGRPRMDDPTVWWKYTSKVENWRKKLTGGWMMRYENNYYHVGNPIPFPVIHPHNMAKDLKYSKSFSLGDNNEEALFLAHKIGCDHLTLYVNARFLWDADQDIEKMLAEYYDKFYGPAAKEMKTALDFAEAKYSRIDKSKPGGRCDPRNVSLPTKIKLLELLHNAKEVAGDSIYGQRIDVIISELPDLETLREEFKALQEKGNPRDNAVEIIATNLKAEEKARTYKLLRTTLMPAKPKLGTMFNVKWTEKSLTFNIRCEEPDMNSIKVGEKVWEGDSLVLLLESPYHSYYQIEVSPDGRIFDADRAGFVVTRWKSMADVTIEKAKDHWTARITVPLAIVGEEGAEGDPMNYVVSPRIKPGHEWFFNLGRRRPRKDGRSEKANRHSLGKTYVLCAGGRGGRNMLARDCFAKLVIK